MSEGNVLLGCGRLHAGGGGENTVLFLRVGRKVACLVSLCWEFV